MKSKIILAAAALCIAASLQAKVTLPSFFGDNMVLQQNADVAVWGTTDKGPKTVTVAPSWTRTKYKVTADAAGKWFLRIPTPSAGGPYSISFNDGDKLTISNVLLGEVWFCSGQSNMEMPMNGFDSQPVEGGTDAILGAKPSVPIRMCTIKRKASLVPVDTSVGSWEENTPEAVAGTSATAYFFATRLHEVLGVPVGLLITDWGGSHIEAWINRETLEAGFKEEFDLAFLEGSEVPKKPHHKPCLLFNGQVAPLVPFTFKGMLWYQGESNRLHPEQYTRLQPAYVKMMREVFENPEAPFYFVQIAPYKYDNPDDIDVGIFNLAQEKTLALIPNSGMAATVDVGEFGTIHPCKKKQVGDRLAFQALVKTYGIKGIEADAPTFKSVVFQDGMALVTMNAGPRGISPRGQDLTGFELAGEDGVWYPATARVSKVYNLKVTSEHVPAPVKVRYCMHDWSVGTVFNGFGIPALPFTTDN